ISYADLGIREWREDVVLDRVTLVSHVDFVHHVVGDDSGEPQNRRMVPLDGLNRIARNEIALLQGVLDREWSFERVAFVLITAGESVLGVDHIIEITHAIVFFEYGGDGVSLKSIAAASRVGRNSRAGNQVSAV